MALHHIISNGLYKGIDSINDFTPPQMVQVDDPWVSVFLMTTQSSLDHRFDTHLVAVLYITYTVTSS